MFCKKCGKKCSLFSVDLTTGTCTTCANSAREAEICAAEEKRKQAMEAPRGVALKCKIPSQPLKAGEKILGPAFTGVFRDAIAKIQDSKIAFVCEAQGEQVEIAGIELQKMQRVGYAVLSMGSQRRLGVSRAAMLGLVLAIPMFISVGAGVGWDEVFDEATNFLILAAVSLLAAQILSFVVSFIPVLVRTAEDLVLFTLWDDDGGGVLIAVEPERQQQLIDVLSRHGLVVEPESKLM